MNNSNNNEMPSYNMATISLYNSNTTTANANIFNVINKNNTSNNSRHDNNNKNNFYLNTSQQKTTRTTQTQTQVITAVRTKGSTTVGFNNSSLCTNNSTATATTSTTTTNTNATTVIASFYHNYKSHNKRNYFKPTLARRLATLSKTSVNGKTTFRSATTLTRETFQNVLLAFSFYNPFSHNTVAS